MENHNIKLTLDVFEGPLDLLLYLIRKDNLEISRVSIAVIAAQYLNYLDTVRDLNIDVASEFLLMAAELAHIKSRALLPVDKTAGDGEDEGTNADQLVAKLRLYQRYKQLADELRRRTMLGRDVFKRGSFTTPEDEALIADDKPTTPLGDLEVSTYDLVRVFSELLKRVPPARRNHHVVTERVSVTARIYEILDELRHIDNILFTDLFKAHVEKVEYIVTFLAILEMGKLCMVNIYQTENYGAIRIQRRVTEENETDKGTPVDVNEVTYK